MRAVVVAGDRSLEVREVDTPEPGPGQVRVRVEACGICGSDLHLRPSEAGLPAGSIMGHEFAGVVDALGDGADEALAGARVCVHPFVPTERHDPLAAFESGIGLGRNPGGYAEAVCVDQRMAWRLPDPLPLEQGALVEPLAVALHALDVGAVGPEDPCAVIGAGPIGVMCAVALRARGGERIVVVERNGLRRERIEALGFAAVGSDGVHMAVLEALGGEPPARVLECTGHPAAPGLATELVAPEGICVLVGIFDDPVPVAPMVLMMKEAQLRAALAYRPGDFDEAIELLAAGRVPAEELVTGREPLERAEAMFGELSDPATEHLKVLLVP
ncbi:MAG TPA: alcohol dehydrogenase catalytic domain-containing protein [Thermoleophilaceae bacterium]|nr:alcohol dehydrogenase catalytic domain-containing protein [Thermoleophilaceae bacterium]